MVSSYYIFRKTCKDVVEKLEVFSDVRSSLQVIKFRSVDAELVDLQILCTTFAGHSFISVGWRPQMLSSLRFESLF